MSHQTVQQYQVNVSTFLAGTLIPLMSSGANSNGYANVVFSGNNLIIQWGYQQQAGTTPVNVLINFPIAFPNQFLAGAAATKRSTGGASGVNHINNASTTSMQVVFDALDNQNNLINGGYWVAIGY